VYLLLGLAGEWSGRQKRSFWEKRSEGQVDCRNERVPDGHLVFAGSHGEQEMSGPPHAAGHCLGISTAAICSLVLFWIGLGYAVFFF